MVWLHRQLRTGFWQGLIHGLLAQPPPPKPVGKLRLLLTLVCNISRHMMWGKNATHALIRQNQAGPGLCVQPLLPAQHWSEMTPACWCLFIRTTEAGHSLRNLKIKI